MNMLLNREDSGLLLIDVQEKLTPLVKNSDELVKHCEWLINLAQDLKVPVLVSEQYSKGLQATVAPLNRLIKEKNCFDKVYFSCFRDEKFKEYFKTLPQKQWVLIGIETHVCVMQTALDLKKAGYEIFVVIDAVSSRSEQDHRYGLKRMKQNGVQLVTSEMVFFEWVGKAGTPQFKALSQTYLK